MKTKEQILLEIQDAMTLNKDKTAKCNLALSDARSFIMHETKELQNQLDEEYKHGVNDAWEIARSICKTGYDECSEIFGDSSVEHVIKTYDYYTVREKIVSFKKQKENEINKIHVGDVVYDNNDSTKATILDHGSILAGENYWMVFTENGCVESWCENEFTKTGESVDVCGSLIK